MKLVVTLLVLAVVVIAQTGGYSGWSACSATQSGSQTRSCLNATLGCNGPTSQTCGWTSWSSCTVQCDSGLTTRNCQGSTSCSGLNSQSCNTQPCQNCTVSQWSYPSPCSKQCGTGYSTTSRTILQEPNVAGGGTPCPLLQITVACNTRFCQEFLSGRGFLSWGPIFGGVAGAPPVTISWNIYSDNDNVDIFLFPGDDNYLLYIQDTQRTPAWNTGYSAYRSMLNTDNAFETVQLQAGVNYYLVVDNTPVGAANGNNGQYDPLTIGYNMTGFDLTTIPPPLNTGAASHLTASLAVALAAVFAAFFARL